jgi:release factor glutamine methyltransferase
VQYITGHQEFWSLEFEVNPQVLIPRPESELLVEHGMHAVRQWCATQQKLAPRLLDVGTGSGNLAISLAAALPQSQVWGSDVALDALRMAQANARRLGVADRLRWVCGDLMIPFRVNSRCFALCVANLPYVSVSEWQQLPREIRDHEPRGALVGGDDGLDLIRRLVVTSPGVLAPGGVLLLEVGQGQAPAVIDLMRRSKQFQATGMLQDFAGIARVVWGHVR